MKIAFLTYNLDPRNGWGRLVKETTDRLKVKGVNLKLLSEVNSHYPEEKNVLGRGFKAISCTSKVRGLIKNADLIHSWEGNPYSITAFVSALGLGKKKIITATGAYSVQPLYRSFTKFLLTLAYKNADKIVCISKYIKDEIDKVIPGLSTVVVTPGVDYQKFSGERIKPKERFILGVGNVRRRKGYHISIPAFGMIASKLPDVKYYIAGRLDESFYKRAQELIEEYDIRDRVVFLGSLDDSALKKLYLSAELFILTSVNYGHHFEGFGLVFLEAAAAGLPVIGTKGNGITDAVAENRNGILVEQNDIKGTAEAILKILTDKNLQDKFSEESIKWAKENSWDNMVNNYLNMYNQVLNKNT
jgi:glycosyltransferase involved in cell wall biosynthesis